MNVARLKIPTMVLAVVALVVGVSSGAVAAKLITGADVKDGSLKSADIKNGTLVTKDLAKGGVNGDRLKQGSVGSGKIGANAVSSGKIADGSVGNKDLANGSVTANKLAPGAVAFPQTLWGPVLRNQTGAAQSTLVTGPTGQPMGDGSLQLSTQTATDLAAFGDSVDFAGILVSSLTNLSYSTWTEAPSLVRPSLRIEINPHLVSDAVPGGVFEFTTLTYDPPAGAPGWDNRTNIQDETAWYLTGDEGTTVGCTQASPCTLVHLIAQLGLPDADPEPAAISSGVYFGLGSGVTTPTTTAVDKFVLNNFTFDFEPNGVFLTTS